MSLAEGPGEETPPLSVCTAVEEKYTFTLGTDHLSVPRALVESGAGVVDLLVCRGVGHRDLIWPDAYEWSPSFVQRVDVMDSSAGHDGALEREAGKLGPHWAGDWIELTPKASDDVLLNRQRSRLAAGDTKGNTAYDNYGKDGGTYPKHN